MVARMTADSAIGLFVIWLSLLFLSIAFSNHRNESIADFSFNLAFVLILCMGFALLIFGIWLLIFK